MLGSLLRTCSASSQCITPQTRLFSTSLALHYNPKNAQSTIRVPSKKAQAAKSRRKALVAKKDDERYPKLTLLDAIALLRAVEVASPKATYELTVKTTVGNGVAVPRGRVNLPREAKPKSEEKILVFAEGRLAEVAKKAGAHIVGGEELIDGILNNRIRATTILCTPALIRTITPKLGRFLGPLGLMPSERRGTVTEDIAGYIQKLRGSSEWRADRMGTIRAPIAKLDFSVEEVVTNFRQFLLSIKRATGNSKEADTNTSGGGRPVTPITRVMLSSTQGPGIRIADF